MSAYHNILQELRLQDEEHFRRYLRMNTDTFEFLINKTRHLLAKQNTRFRKAVSPEEQIAITLCFMATGESYSSIMYQFRVSDSTISLMIP